MVPLSALASFKKAAKSPAASWTSYGWLGVGGWVGLGWKVPCFWWLKKNSFFLNTNLRKSIIPVVGRSFFFLKQKKLSFKNTIGVQIFGT